MTQTNSPMDAAPLTLSTPISNTLSQPFTVKLDRNNFSLWKTMVYTIIRGHRSASALWTTLEELYGAHSKANMDDLCTKLQTTRKGAQSND
uniref:Retrotransposon Copia-like N-terminal domain-containing protein n=1 Tax=Cannabis sativa TaxID=3483 RepID=A0A803PAA3_CANSA